MKRIRQIDWSGCYESSWKGLFENEESFSHPAKFSRGLIRRIYEHLRDQYGLRPGAMIVDPFGGIACGAMDAMNLGYQWIGCELEPRFVAMAERNIAKWRWFFPHATARIVCGDSRRLRECIGPVLVECVVGSPPFGEVTPARGDPNYNWKFRGDQTSYGTSPGQLGAMPAGSVDCVLSSPPYAETLKGDGTPAETAAESRAKRQTPGGSLGQSQRTQGYGSKGNLGNLPAGCVEAIVASPPFSDAEGFDDRVHETGKATVHHGGDGKGGTLKPGGRAAGMGSSPGQLNGTTGETFWSAAMEIVRESCAILRPGGLAAWVVKNFVRQGKIVDFCGDWRRLCESVGFVTVEEIHASLVKTDVHPGLFGESVIKRTERKGFFRRNCESKAAAKVYWESMSESRRHWWLAFAAEAKPKAKPFSVLQFAQGLAYRAAGRPKVDSPRIDYEVVWIMQRPEAAA